MEEKNVFVSLRRITIIVVMAIATVSCGNQRDGDPTRATGDTSPTGSGHLDAGAPRTDSAATNTGDSGTVRDDGSTKALPGCGLVGDRRELPPALASDVVLVNGRPMVIAILARPRREPLDLEGNEPLPELRSSYLIGMSEEGEPLVTHLADDPGPVRDHFGRRMYERLADVHGVCDRSGCLVSVMVERYTPGTKGSAFASLVQTLDDQGVPQGDGSKLRRMAQEPERGDEIATCLGVSNEGYLLATAVQKGRGRLLWTDRRATPLDMSYVPGGFDSCSVWPLGLGLEVAAGGPEGISMHGMGRDESPDGGPGPWRPELGEGTKLPVLTSSGGTRAIVYTDDEAVRSIASSRPEPFQVFDFEAQQLAVSPVGETLLAVALDDSKQVALARVDPSQGVTARSSLSSIKAAQVWVLGDEQVAWLGWSEGEGKAISLQRVECPLSGTGSGDGGSGASSKSISDDDLERADRGSIKQLLSLAREARVGDHNYRAAWLLERAYHLAPSDPEAMVDSAGLLTEIRYTKSALRQLERLSKLGDSNARKALHSACNDRDFERLWSAGEFQRITGCRAPAQPPPDAGADEDQQELDEGTTE